MSESTSRERPEGDRLSELGRRRGLFFPSFESYGGVAGFYTYGPRGAAAKQHLESAWRDRFTIKEDNVEISGPTVTPGPVLDASGHTEEFDDMLITCGSCEETHRADHLIEAHTDIEDAETLATQAAEDLIDEHEIPCPSCGEPLTGQPIEGFNLMFETSIGPGNGDRAFLRPETAQSIFVEFPRLAEYARNDLPFGVTQIGPGYRNEISPRRGLIRVREFTMAELELFIDPERNEPDLRPVADVEVRLYPVDRQQEETTAYLETTIGAAVEAGIIGNAWIGYYLGIAQQWYERVGVDPNRLRFRQHQAEERSHYATDCWDAESEIDGDCIEIAGFAHRGCYDLAKHHEHSTADYEVFIPHDEPIEREVRTVSPEMGWLGPTFGEDAPRVAEALERLVETQPDAFEAEVVTVDVGGEEREVPVEHTGFAVETVTETGEHILPEVIEPSFGVDRTLYTIFAHSLRTDEIEGETRTFLALPPEIAPTTVAVFPLMERDGLGDRAQEIADALRSAGYRVDYDDSGNIGRRYRRQDEIGTPFCVTVDYETLETDTVTIRDRDSTEQIRVDADDLQGELDALMSRDRRISAG